MAWKDGKRRVWVLKSLKSGDGRNDIYDGGWFYYGGVRGTHTQTHTVADGNVKVCRRNNV